MGLTIADVAARAGVSKTTVSRVLNSKGEINENTVLKVRRCGDGLAGEFAAVSEAVGLGAGLEDVAAEGEPVDDGGAESGVGEGLAPAGEGVVGGDGDGVLLLAFGEDLEEEFGAAAVELHVAEFVDAEQVDAAVAGDGLGQDLLVGGLDQLVVT